MALTVNVYYTGEENNARRFAEEMISSGTVAKIRTEKGNIRYEYFSYWMMKTIIELRKQYDLHMKVERYVSDDGGIPKADAMLKKMLDLELTPGCIMIVINI